MRLSAERLFLRRRFRGQNVLETPAVLKEYQDPKRSSDQRRQGQLRLDGTDLDLLDQPQRQIHVELLHVLVTHGSMLANYQARWCE